MTSVQAVVLGYASIGEDSSETDLITADITHSIFLRILSLKKVIEIQNIILNCFGHIFFTKCAVYLPVTRDFKKDYSILTPPEK